MLRQVRREGKESDRQKYELRNCRRGSDIEGNSVSDGTSVEETVTAGERLFMHFDDMINGPEKTGRIQGEEGCLSAS